MRTRPAAGTPAARSCCTMLFRLAANSASGTCCLGFSSFSALSLAPKKTVTATGLSEPSPFLRSLGRIMLAHLVL